MSLAIENSASTDSGQDAAHRLRQPRLPENHRKRLAAVDLPLPPP